MPNNNPQGYNQHTKRDGSERKAPREASGSRGRSPGRQADERKATPSPTAPPRR